MTSVCNFSVKARKKVVSIYDDAAECCCSSPTLRPRKNGQVEIFLSLIHLHSRMCIRICIFVSKKTKNKQTKTESKRNYSRKHNICGKSNGT